MATLKIGDRVNHKSDASLGVGVVDYVREVAGVGMAYVVWDGTTSPVQYNESQLCIVEDLPGQLAEVGPRNTVPFQLRVLGRWFEARHEETGEITNQPFDMLPHQVVVTNRVFRSSPADDGGRHWLIADDVGLGKTIEAGMIEEVMRRQAGGSLRCLIVAPAGLVRQWQIELAERFGRIFDVFETDKPNKLQTFDQMVASIHTLRQFVNSGPSVLDVHPWDLVIFDEAHHLTKPGVLMYELARYLREKKCKNTLFLTATPYSGNHEHFCNMLHLLRPDLVDKPAKGLKQLPHLPLKEMMARNRKHLVTDAKGNKIFRGIAKTMIIPFQPTEDEIAFAAELKRYLKHGYNEAGKLDKQGQTAVGFLMATFGKLASSSRAALKSALERRIGVLRSIQGGTVDGANRASDEDAAGAVSGAIGKGKKVKQSLIAGEADLVEDLLDRLESLPGRDSKLEGFVQGLDKLVEANPAIKLLIFTEYLATQKALANTLAARFGMNDVDIIHGSKSMEARKQIVARFNEQEEPRFLVSTAAGGEGLNLQHRCHTIVNYDLPWSPTVLQQRIGRVYRYGQTNPVVVYNLRVETDSDAFADNKVYQYLERRLNDVVEMIAQATGEGKEDLVDDVLGQAAEQGLSLEELYQTAIEEGEEKAKRTIDERADHLQQIMADPEMTGLFKGLPHFNLDDYRKLESRVTSDHLEYFVRQYCEHQQLEFRYAGPKRFSFKPREFLADLAADREKRDPYAVAGNVSTQKIDNATVDKEIAQNGGRLLRFGDPVFEAMVHHVQYSVFSQVASLDVPAEHLGWARCQQGIWQLFELKVTRTDGNKTLVLRRELDSFVVPIPGDTAVPKPELIEQVVEMTQGPPKTDVAAARQAFEIAREAANERLRAVTEEVRAEYSGDEAIEAITPVPVSDLALAWVRAV